MATRPTDRPWGFDTSGDLNCPENATTQSRCFGATFGSISATTLGTWCRRSVSVNKWAPSNLLCAGTAFVAAGRAR